MKLYTFDPAPNPRRLGLFMAYKGIDIETTQIDLMNREQFGDEFQQINPQGTVPALLLDDGTVLTEVIGMCVYLEALFPEKPLLGSTALEKAQIMSWDHKLFNMVLMGVAEALRNDSPNFANRALPGPLDVPQIPELAARGKMRLTHAWPALDAELAGRDWLVGEGITMADIDLLVCVEFSAWVKASPPQECQNLHAHAERVKNALNPD
jgi:glutathione S-transferase